MRLFLTYLVLLACLGPKGVCADLELVAADKSPDVFGGHTNKIALLWRNPADTVLETNIQMRLLQLTSATAFPITESFWKRLQVLPGQTISETAALEFPAVNAETRFLVQWVESKNQIIGATEVHVYPTNLLAELQPLIGHEDGALGIFDPENQLKPLLNSVKVNFVDLGNVELEKYRGKLTIIGPFESKTQIDPQLSKKIKTMAKKGVAVVWLQPPVQKPPLSGEQPTPSFYWVMENQTAVVIAEAHMVADLTENPRSQLNLVYFCRMALNPQPLTLPFSQTQAEY